MPLKRIDDPSKRWVPKICRSPEHDPPAMMVYPPGTYEWECPACGRKLTFTVAEGPTLSGAQRRYNVKTTL